MKISFFYNYNFILAILLVVLSLLSFYSRRHVLSLVFLFFSSLFLGLFVIHLDPFINLWDEQFHALVAKNFIDHPLKPILIEDPLFGYDKGYWSYCHVWLHKQPLFLWQMALSLKCFGLNYLGVRFPSVLMHAVLVFFIFRIGKIVHSDKLGYYSALFFSFSCFPLEYLTGFYATDHNDIAFMFYSFSSIWALIEYYQSKKTIFLILVGLFSGGSILCKWLTGLLVYGIWFIIIIYDRRKANYLREFSKLLLSVSVCLVVFLPWQIFAIWNYPAEYQLAMDFNSKHIFEPLEGHGGGYLFYYDALFEEFGSGLLTPAIVIISFLFFIFSLKDKAHSIIIFLTVTVTYTFFTFVSTKMYGYVFLCFPFFTMGLAYLFDGFFEKVKTYIKRYIYPLNFFLVLVFLVFLMNPSKLYKHHSDKELGRYKSRLVESRETQLFLTLKEQLGDEKYLIFNCNTSLGAHILAIFYTSYPSFNFVLSKLQIEKARKLNYKIIAIDNGKLPDYVLEDKSIMRIKF